MDLKLGVGSKAGDFLSGKREGGREKGEGGEREVQEIYVLERGMERDMG